MKKKFDCPACFYSFEVEIDEDRPGEIICPLCGESMNEHHHYEEPKGIWQTLIDFFGAGR